MADKVYRFVMRKEKKFIKKFNPIKKKSVGLGSIKEILVALFKLKTRKSDAKSEQVLKKHRPILGGVMRNVFLVVGAIILLLGLLVGYILFSIQGAGLGGPAASESMAPSLKLDVLDTGIANINDQHVFTPYAIAKIERKNIKSVGVYMEAADGPLYNQVYILNSRREQGDTYSDFKRELQNDLAKSGLTVNEIYLSELESIPLGSNPLIIVPTGYIPVSLCTTNGEGKNLRELAEKGATIIYMGYGFDEGILDERRGRLFPGSDYSVAAISKNLGDVEISEGAGKPEGLNLNAIRYSLQYYSSDPKLGIKLVYGGIPVIKWNVGGGYLVMVPNTLDSGWKNGKAAAHDIAKMIRDAKWLKAFDEYIGVSPADYPTTDDNVIYDTLIIPSGKADINQSNIRLYVVGYDENQNIVAVQTKYISLKRTQNGLLKNPLYALSEKMSGSKIDLDAYFDENPNKFNRPVGVVVHAVNASNEAAIEDVSFYSSAIVPIKHPQVAQYNPNFNPGRYIIKLETISTQPYTLAQSVLIVPEIAIVPYLIDWKKQEFMFTVDAHELGDNDMYTQSLDKTYVTIDDNEKTRTLISIKKIGDKTIAYFKVAEPLQEGVVHTFRFEVQNGLEYSEIAYVSRNYWEQWWFWTTLGFAGLIVTVGIFFKAKEKVRYAIDIPDFEIRKKRRIYIKEGIVLDLFNNINKDYGWEYMPLTLKELKSGFRKITYQGRPILIGDYNLQLLLDKMKYGGLVKQYLGLYSLGKWEKESMFDYKYLSIFRKVRDIFINLAIPFTKLGERKDCDIYLKSRRESFKVVLGEGGNLADRVALGIGGRERTLLVFSDEDMKSAFVESITRYGINSAAIKIALLNNKLIPMTINELRMFVK